jgi:hypothetical protein
MRSVMSDLQGKVCVDIYALPVYCLNPSGKMRVDAVSLASFVLHLTVL